MSRRADFAAHLKLTTRDPANDQRICPPTSHSVSLVARHDQDAGFIGPGITIDDDKIAVAAYMLNAACWSLLCTRPSLLAILLTLGSVAGRPRSRRMDNWFLLIGAATMMRSTMTLHCPCLPCCRR